MHEIENNRGSYPWVTDMVNSPVGKIPQVSSKLSDKDLLGILRVRLGYKRNEYQVLPGLYALGVPDDKSPVLVTANYKLSFDMLRKELSGINAWILVLDTLGINVWCAAGKGTFGTEELVRKIEFSGLKDVVSHRVVILPQLGASGVAAHEVARRTGFKVVYGPVRAEDIPEFLSSGLVATKEMRTVKFGFIDRLKLTPVEVIHAAKPLLLILLAVFLLNIISRHQITFPAVIIKTLFNFLPYLVAVLLGCLLAPALLPWIPFRSFTMKGLLLGTLWAAFVVLFPEKFLFMDSWLLRLSNILILPAIVSYLTLNFTGSTTYTSFSGVKKEMKMALLPMIAATGLGVILIIADKIIELVR